MSVITCSLSFFGDPLSVSTELLQPLCLCVACGALSKAMTTLRVHNSYFKIPFVARKRRARNSIMTSSNPCVLIVFVLWLVIVCL